MRVTQLGVTSIHYTEVFSQLEPISGSISVTQHAHNQLSRTWLTAKIDSHEDIYTAFRIGLYLPAVSLCVKRLSA